MTRTVTPMPLSLLLKGWCAILILMVASGTFLLVLLALTPFIWGRWAPEVRRAH